MPRTCFVAALAMAAACSSDTTTLSSADTDTGSSRTDGGADLVDSGFEPSVPDAGHRCSGAAPDDRLALSLLECTAMQPGEQRDFDLHAERCCYYLEPVSACERWRISPPVPGVSVDAEGVVSVGPDVPPGTMVNVVAEVGDGTLRTARETIEVYSAEALPLQRSFREQARYSCDDGREQPTSEIGEATFCGSTFTVTYQPFEVYKDYWGTWSYEPATNAIRMVVGGGNFIPQDLDLDGTLEFDGRDIILRDMWLGAPPFAEPATRSCGHRLR